ncbi:hypothetical protein GCM10023187_26050 [Nibrella viscosa]|uniref:Uncharacterized protein n=1 Tax=Nibrella viscosa TaxID=1084524 RepID=A0ABP8KGF3_9BACT
MTATKSSSRSQSTPVLINRLVYGGFVILSIYFLLQNDPANALVNLGIALVADPFNPSVSWKDRPFWQRAWLVVHLLVLLTMLLFTWF